MATPTTGNNAGAKAIRNAGDTCLTYDYLVLGSGIAGLTFALKVATIGTVAVITKKDRG